MSPVFFRYFASGFCISAPAQLHVTDAVVYTASSNAPAHHITAPAQPPRLMPGRVSGLVLICSVQVVQVVLVFVSLYFSCWPSYTSGPLRFWVLVYKRTALRHTLTLTLTLNTP